MASCACARVRGPRWTVRPEQTCKQTDAGWTSCQRPVCLCLAQGNCSVKPFDRMNEQPLEHRDAVKTVSVIDTLVLER